MYVLISLVYAKYLGGAFALYSFICRHVKASLIPNQQPEDKELSNYRLEPPVRQHRLAETVKHKLENSKVARVMLLLVTITGTSMVIGDGILTPSISGYLFSFQSSSSLLLFLQTELINY